jgi:hypothetical protein
MFQRITTPLTGVSLTGRPRHPGLVGRGYRRPQSSTRAWRRYLCHPDHGEKTSSHVPWQDPVLSDSESLPAATRSVPTREMTHHWVDGSAAYCPNSSALAKHSSTSRSIPASTGASPYQRQQLAIALKMIIAGDCRSKLPGTDSVDGHPARSLQLCQNL